MLSLSKQQEILYDDDRNELILTQLDLKTIPENVINTYGHFAEHLDLGHNRITNFDWIYSFERLKYLILDCNRLREAHLEQLQQPLRHIRGLMLNKNEFSDLINTVAILRRIFPKLEYLSLHGNPLCPDGLDLQPFSQYINYEYDHYRSFVQSAFPALKFLDHCDLQQHRLLATTVPPNVKYSKRTTNTLWSKLRVNIATPCKIFSPMKEWSAGEGANSGKFFCSTHSSPGSQGQ